MSSIVMDVSAMLVDRTILVTPSGGLLEMRISINVYTKHCNIYFTPSALF